MIQSLETIAAALDLGQIKRGEAIELLRRREASARGEGRITIAAKVLTSIVQLIGDVDERAVAEAYRIADLLIRWNAEHPAQQS